MAIYLIPVPAQVMGNEDDGTPVPGVGSVVIGAADPFLPEAIEMLWEMRREIDSMYGEVTTSPPPQEEFTVPRAAFLVARSGGAPVACGGLRPWDEVTGIIKRLYVSPAWRRKGIARQLMRELEAKAGELGYRRVMVDTGYLQSGAIALYASLWYVKVPCTGRKDVKDWGVCLEKGL